MRTWRFVWLVTYVDTLVVNESADSLAQYLLKSGVNKFQSLISEECEVCLL